MSSSLYKDLTGSYTKREMLRKMHMFMRNKASIQSVPLAVMLEVTGNCSLNCEMCYMRLTPDEKKLYGRELSTEEWINIGTQAINAGALFISFTGGEPFTRHDFREIYENLYDNGGILSIMTNATLINESTISWLKYRKPASVAVTLYGASKSTYEKMCGEGSGELYNDVINALRLLKDNSISFIIKMTVTVDNYFDYDKVKTLASELNVEFYAFPFVEDARDNIKRDARKYKPCDEICDKILPPHEISDDEWRLLQNGIIEREKKNANGDNNKKGLNCMAGNSMCWITWYGMLRCCASLPYGQQDISNANKTFIDAWKDLVAIVNEYPRISECDNCPLVRYCINCAEAHYNYTKEYGVKSEQICKNTQRRCNRYLECTSLVNNNSKETKTNENI